VLRLTEYLTKTSTARQPRTQIAQYQLLGRLASGGMAETYLGLSGELPGLRSLVVVKRILPHLSSQEQFVRMFFDEARIGALLDHPNIARIIEVGRDEDGYFLVIEPVQGKSLSAVVRRAALRNRPLGQAQIAFIVGQAANGLGYAHALTDADGQPLNVVHRDISPQNILVSFEGAVKVIDFGIASALGRITETIPGDLKGKIEYMSPEQASGAVADRRSDIFALGVVLWEALCGRRLFRRETELATMRAIVDKPIPRPPRAALVPPGLERIVMRALEKEPEDRFQDAREMSLLLQQHAFASGGFNLVQLAARMKSLFPADHAGWKAAASAAVDIQGGARPRKITASFSFANSPDSHTAEPTVMLEGDSQPEASGRTAPEDKPSDAGQSSGAKLVRPDLPSPFRLRVTAGLAVLLGLICLAGGILRARARPSVPVVVATTTDIPALMVVVPMPSPEPVPVAPPASAPGVPTPADTVTDGQIAEGPPAPSLSGEALGRGASLPTPSAQRTAVHDRDVPATHKTDLRRRAPARRVAKAKASKRVSVHAKSASVPAKNPAATTHLRAGWRDPFN
jgi:eukaryotic-like serine/threonine-protein kinase